MIVLDLIQGSDEWLLARCGKATASRMGDLMARTKSGWGASRANYQAELVIERLTGKPADRFVSPAMEWGSKCEPEARALYEFLYDCEVRQVGLVAHETIAHSLASPDGLIGSDGLVEIKCPNSATHVQTLLGAPIADAYHKQMAWQMACTGRKWCDFVSYDPRLPPEMQIHVTRVKRNDDLIRELEVEVSAFLSEVAETVEKLRAKYQPQAEAA